MSSKRIWETEDGARANAGVVAFFDAVVEDSAHVIKVGLHG